MTETPAKSLTYIIKSKCHKIDPCGTPPITPFILYFIRLYYEKLRYINFQAMSIFLLTPHIQLWSTDCFVIMGNVDIFLGITLSNIEYGKFTLNTQYIIQYLNI